MRFLFLRLLLAVAIFGGGQAHSACWESAAARSGVEVELLKAIGWVESRWQPKAVGPALPNGDVALGLMQINTVHLPALAQQGIRREDLFDECTSQQLGGWVLADCIQRFGYTWKAVGCYNTGPHSKNIDAQIRYVAQVQHHYWRFKSQQSSSPAALAKSSIFLQSTE